MIVRSPWQRQPPSGALNNGHWLVKKIRQGVYAAASGERYVLKAPTSDTTTQAARLGGIVTRLAGSSGYVTAPSVADTGDWAIVSFGVLRSSGAASAIATMAEAPGDPTYDRSLLVTSTGVVNGYMFDGVERTVATTATVSVGVPTLVACSTGFVGSNVFYAWVGNDEGSVSSGTAFTGYASPEFVIGYGGGASAFGGATLTSVWDSFYTFLINGKLSRDEFKQLQRNPWQIFAPVAPRIIVGPPAATGTTITPSTGSLVLTGSQPSVNTAFTISPSTGSLVISGSQATRIVGTGITPSAGSLVISGAQPVLSLGTGITPAAGSLVISGSQPSLSTAFNITPSAGALVITGSQPGVSNSGATSFTITPATGSLVISGSSPIQGIGVTPTAGTLTLSGSSLSMDLGKVPSAGSLVISGSQPQVRTDSFITPTTGSLVITGSQPQITAPVDVVITPGTGSLNIAANQPQISNSTVVFLDTHDGFRKKKGKDKETERAQQFKERQEKRRKLLEEAISPPEEPQKEEKTASEPVSAPKSPPIAANADVVTTMATVDTEAEDEEIVMAFLKQLEADEERLIQQLFKRA